MNANERIKHEKDGLDVLEDIRRYAQTGFGSIHEDDFVRMRWYGLYQQRPNVGHFMLRIKVPSGDLTVPQLRAVEHVTRTYARDVTDVTTRQNFQFHWLTIEDMPAIFELFARVGITSQGACGDIFRNVTGCPVAGIDPREVFDARPWAGAVHEFFLDNKAFSNLPRKYKTSVAGCCDHCAQPEINDIGATGVIRKRLDGSHEQGFHLRVGGGLSSRPFLAKKLDMFVHAHQLVEVFAAITTLFRDHGNRENRKKARLKFLVDEWGIERFEAEVRSLLSFAPEPALDWQEPVTRYRDHMGVYDQKQPGHSWLGVTVLSGRLNADQVGALARVAEEFGSGVVRTTNQQNVIVPDVPNHKVEAAIRVLEDAGLVTSASSYRRAAVACTGNEFCNLALTETKRLIVEIVHHLEKSLPELDEPLRINLNGCPNSCGQHHIGDIGLQGCLLKQDGRQVEGYDIFLGGRLGHDAKFVRPIWRKVPAGDVALAIENLLVGYLGARDEEEDFPTFVDRHSDDELAGLMRTRFAEGVPTAQGVGRAAED